MRNKTLNFQRYYITAIRTAVASVDFQIDFLIIMTLESLLLILFLN